MTILVKVTVQTLCAMNCCQPVSSRMACIFFEFHIYPPSFFLSRSRWCQNPLNHFFHSGSLPFISSDLFVAVRPRLHHGLAPKTQGNWSRSSMTSSNSCRRPPVFLWQIVLDVKWPVHVAVPLEKSLYWGLGCWPSAVAWVVPFLGCQSLEACSTYNICRFGVVCLCLSQAFAQGAPRGEHLALRIFTILLMISIFSFLTTSSILTDLENHVTSLTCGDRGESDGCQTWNILKSWNLQLGFHESG